MKYYIESKKNCKFQTSRKGETFTIIKLFGTKLKKLAGWMIKFVPAKSIYLFFINIYYNTKEENTRLKKYFYILFMLLFYICSKYSTIHIEL